MTSSSEGAGSEAEVLARKLDRAREQRDEAEGTVEYAERERDTAEAVLAGVRRYAQEGLDEATSPDADNYEPGDEDSADMLVSARHILRLCGAVPVMSKPVVTDEMVAAAAEEIREQFDSGHRGHWCTEWDDGDGCELCREIAAAAITAALDAEHGTAER